MDDQARQHPWEIIYVGAQRQARHAGGLGDEDRRTWITWLRRFGIDPDDVLLDPFFLVAEDDHRTIRYLGAVRNEDGTPLLRGTQIERCVVTVQLEAPAPPFPGEGHSRAWPPIRSTQS
jgi:hypothetical protein